MRHDLTLERSALFVATLTSFVGRCIPGLTKEAIFYRKNRLVIGDCAACLTNAKGPLPKGAPEYGTDEPDGD